MTVYQALSGATVFATSSMQCNWGLNDYNAPNSRLSLIIRTRNKLRTIL